MINKLKKLRNEIMADITCDIYSMTHEPTAKHKTGAGLIAGTAVVMGSMATVLAEPKFFSSLEKMMDNMYGWILGISSSLAILLLAWNLIKYMAASDPQEAKIAKDKIKKIIFAWVIINVLGAIPSVIQSLTSGSDWRGHTGDFQ